MSDEELGRAMYDVGCNAAKAKSEPWTPWGRLSPEKQAALIRVAVRARDEYRVTPDPISRGGVPMRVDRGRGSRVRFIDAQEDHPRSRVTHRLAH